MTTTVNKIRDIEEYIAGFPVETRKILEKIRATVKEAAPEAGETIKYAMPTFTLKGNLVSFAAYKNHIGLYPAPLGNEALQKELSLYKAAKSTLRFPLDKPIPYDLITKIIRFRVKETLEKAKTKNRS